MGRHVNPPPLGGLPPGEGFPNGAGVPQGRSQKQPPGPPGLPGTRLRWEFKPFGLPLRARPQRVLGRQDATRGRRSLELGTSPGLPHGSPVTLSPSAKPEPRFPTCVNALRAASPIPRGSRRLQDGRPGNASPGARSAQHSVPRPPTAGTPRRVTPRDRARAEGPPPSSCPPARC